MEFSWLNISFPFFNGAPEKVPVSVNWCPNTRCNYECHFCAHTNTNEFILPIEDAKRGLRMLVDAGMRKLNISGGEPFLQPYYIGEIFKFCKEELHIESCSVLNNGSKVTEEWLDTYGQYLDVMVISCNSFDAKTNIKQGRTENGTSITHTDNVFKVTQWAKDRDIKVKINTAVTTNNWEEDMNDQIEQLAPFSWEVFRVLPSVSENSGNETGPLADTRNLVITKEQFQTFLTRHSAQRCLIPEDNEAMKDSYLNLDERMRFLNYQDGVKRPGRSLLEVGVQDAIQGSDFDQKTFEACGGILGWKREVPESLEW